MLSVAKKLYWDILYLLALPFLANVIAGWWQVRRPLMFVAFPEYFTST